MSASLLRLLEAPTELPELPGLGGVPVGDHVATRFDFGGHMDARREASIERISARVEKIHAAGLGLTMGDLALVIRDAFQDGASAAVDGMTARESARTMAEWEELERREKQVAKMRAFPPVMVLDRPMPLWSDGSDLSDRSDKSEPAEEGGRAR